MRIRLLVLACLVSAVAAAQVPPIVTPPPIGSAPIPSPPPRDEGTGIMMSLLLRGAGLSSEQSERVRRILTNHRPAIQSLRRQLRVVQDEMADRITAPGELKLADLHVHLARVGKLRLELAEEMTQAALEVRAILTPEQIQRAAKWKDRVRAVQGELRTLFGDEDDQAN